MSYNFDHYPEKTIRICFLLAAALVLLAWAFIGLPRASAQNFTAPATPATITPPVGNRAFLVAHAVGTQGYVCLPSTTGASWTINGSRPEAALFADDPGHKLPILTHFLSPTTTPNESAPKPLPFGSATWQSSADGSKVWGQMLQSISAGSDASCPNAGAIDCLLLHSIGSENGPGGGNFIARTTFIQRLNTKGGAAAATGCSVAADVGKQLLVPYTADYYFFRQSRSGLKARKFEFR